MCLMSYIPVLRIRSGPESRRQEGSGQPIGTPNLLSDLGVVAAEPVFHPGKTLVRPISKERRASHDASGAERSCSCGAHLHATMHVQIRVQLLTIAQDTRYVLTTNFRQNHAPTLPARYADRRHKGRDEQTRQLTGV